MKDITDYVEKEQVDQILGAAKMCSIREEWFTDMSENEGDIGPDNPDTAQAERRIKLLIESDPDRPSNGYPHENLFSRHFPFNCLTPGLAKMAVRSVFEFVGEFCERMEIGSVTLHHPLLEPPSSVIYL